MKAKKQHSKIPGKRFKHLGTKARELIKGWPRGRSTTVSHVNDQWKVPIGVWPFGRGLKHYGRYYSSPLEYLESIGRQREDDEKLEVDAIFEADYHKKQQQMVDRFIALGKPLKLSVGIEGYWWKLHDGESDELTNRLLERGARFDQEETMAIQIAEKMLIYLRGLTLTGSQVQVIRQRVEAALADATRWEYTTFSLNMNQIAWANSKREQLTHSRVVDDDLEVHPGYPGICGVDW